MRGTVHQHFKVINQLKTEHKEYFESCLAIALSKNLSTFPAVNKVSAKIHQYMLENKKTMLSKIEKEPKIRTELYSKKYFGHLSSNSITAETIYNDIINTLESPNAEFSQVMQIHSLFSYRLIDASNSTEAKILDKLGLFAAKHRHETCTNIPGTCTPGITRNKVWEKQLKEPAIEHEAAKWRFSPESNSEFFRLTQQHQLPFVCGPSGHTRSFLKMAIDFGQLNLEERHEYALAIFAFLAAGGNHSFHEVMAVAQHVGIPYSNAEYAGNIPLKLMQNRILQRLAEQFPQYLSQEQNSSNLLQIR